MKNIIIEYPMDIRNLCGMSTVIFTHSNDTARKLRGLLPDDYQIIHYDFSCNTEDKFDWLKEALFYSHIFVVSDLTGIDSFLFGVSLVLALEQNPELILGLNIDPNIQVFLNKLSQADFHNFSSITEIAKFIGDQE
jgi:hypothetical protein